MERDTGILNLWLFLSVKLIQEGVISGIFFKITKGSNGRRPVARHALTILVNNIASSYIA
jgi:hypothetical protein